MNSRLHSFFVIACILLCSFLSLPAQQPGDVMVSTDSGQQPSQAAATAALQRIEAAQAAENQSFAARKQAVRNKGASPENNELLKQEVRRHLEETKKLSLQKEAARKQVVSELKQRWETVDSSWKNECARHDTAVRDLEKLPSSPERNAKIDAENAAHRNTSRKLAVDRDLIHQGVMNQANAEVAGGSKTTSAKIEATKGTRVTDPNHRGMPGDWDGGGGFRTTEKASKILNEMGVKGPEGKPVRVRNGVLETAPDFGMTVNTTPGADRVGSAAHQAQVKMGAAHGETYISETPGAVKSAPLKDHLATLDHTKKSLHGLNEVPGKLVGASPEGQAMVKGALKSANQAGLPPETVEAIARKRGIANPEKILDRMADIKTGRSTISSADEAAKLQGVTRDIVNASETATRAKANAEIQQTQKKIADLEAKGKTAEAGQLREELADYRAKAKASSDAIRSPEKTASLPEPAKNPSSAVEPTKNPVSPTSETAPKSKTTASSEPVSKPKVPAGAEPEAKPTAGGKLMRGAGFALGAYGIYEGYETAKEEMNAKKQAEPKTFTEKAGNKLELAGRTLWHGLGFGAAQEVGTQAGKESYEQYKKDIADKKISPDSVRSYAWMKTRAVLGGLFGGVKAITYDAAKNSGTSLGNAIGEGLGAAKEKYDASKNAAAANLTAAEQSKRIHDLLIKKGASPLGAQRAADLALKGDYSEAKRINKILDAKIAAKKEADEVSEQRRTRSWGQRKKSELRKENTKKEIETQDKSSEDELKQRELVAGKLRAKGLPTAADLLDRLVAVLQKEGEKGLDEAIAEFTQMQGSFSGSAEMLDGPAASLKLQISGNKVTGFLSLDSRKTESLTITTQKMNIPMRGVVDMISGSIEIEGSGPMTTSCGINPASSIAKDMKNFQPTTTTTQSKWLFRGTYNGKGYKGSVAQPWSVAR